MFLEVKKLKKSFGQGENSVEVLKEIDFNVAKGEICVMLGPSGSGKSTLLNIIGGIDNGDEGYVAINGEKTLNMSEGELTNYRRKHLGYIFQMYNLIPNLNVKENIEVGAYLSDNPLDIDELLNTLGLYEHRNKLPNQLSGGQQQRTAIGRAIVKNPDILFSFSTIFLICPSFNLMILSAIFFIASLCVTMIIVLPYFFFTSSINCKISFEVL